MHDRNKILNQDSENFHCEGPYIKHIGAVSHHLLELLHFDLEWCINEGNSHYGAVD